MNLNGINTASRLREICKAITEHADQFQMAGWFRYLLDGGEEAGGCGTAACIAGWAHHLFTAKAKTLEASNTGENWHAFQPFEILGLPNFASRRLFHLENWPTEFYARYRNAQTPADRAAIAVERISHFIATEGKE